MDFVKNLERIERLDQLIKLEATGNPKELAKRLGISERQVYRIINQMRFLGAEINYSKYKETFVYTTSFTIDFKFYDYRK